MQFSPDGRFVATGTDKSARIFEAMTGREIALMSHDNTVTDIQFSRDGRYLATNSYDNSFKVFEVTTRKEIFRINHESSILDINFNLSGQYVATGGEDGKTRVSTRAQARKSLGSSMMGRFGVFSFSADGRSIRSLASKPGWIGVYSELLAPRRPHCRSVSSPDSQPYVSGVENLFVGRVVSQDLSGKPRRFIGFVSNRAGIRETRV